MITIRGKALSSIVTAATAISSISLAGAAIPGADHTPPPPNNRFVVTSITLNPNSDMGPPSAQSLQCFDQKGDCTAIVTIKFDIALPSGIPALLGRGYSDPLSYSVTLQHVHSMDEIRQRLPAAIDKIPDGMEEFLRLFHATAKKPVE